MRLPKIERSGRVPVVAVLLLALLALLPAAASAKVFSPTSFTLDNGLQVVVVENHRAPVVTQMVWYKVGAADEPQGKSGIAHFLEHLMFKGTKSTPPGVFSDEIARRGGEENAFTTQDYTAYFQSVAVEHLDLVMRLEADRMANLVLSDAVVLPERDVILEERRQRIDSQPSSQLGEMARAALYLNHPYRIPTIGWAHEMRGLTTADAVAFYERWYAPDNAILILSGDVTVDAVRTLAEKYYGPVPRRDVPERVRLIEPEQLAPRQVALESERVQQPSWSRQYVAPSYRRGYGAGEPAQAYALEVLDEILGGGPTSRLYRRLVVEQRVATSAGSWYSPDAVDYGAFGFSGSPLPGGKAEDVGAALEAEIARLLKDGVTEEEVAAAKALMQADAVKATDGVSAAARVIGAALATGSTIEDVEEWPERIGAVTVEQVNAAARAVLRPENSVTGLLLAKPTS